MTSRWVNAPSTKTRSIGPSPTTRYAIWTSPLRAKATSLTSVSSRRDVRAVRRLRRGTVQDRLLVAVHRAARAQRDRQLWLGRDVARRRRRAALTPGHRHVRRGRSRAREGRGADDARAARPPAPAVEAVDHRTGRHAAVR